MPLSQANPGSTVRLKRIQGGERFTHRLLELGLTQGVEVKIYDVQHHGPVVIGVRGSKFAIGRTMADKIFVEALQS